MGQVLPLVPGDEHLGDGGNHVERGEPQVVVVRSRRQGVLEAVAAQQVLQERHPPHPVRVLRGQGRRHRGADVVRGDVVPVVAQRGHHARDVTGEGRLVVGSVKVARPAHAAQVDRDHPEGVGQRQQDLPPSAPGLEAAVDQDEGSRRRR
jgi:hypothetical protein